MNLWSDDCMRTEWIFVWTVQCIRKRIYLNFSIRLLFSYIILVFPENWYTTEPRKQNPTSLLYNTNVIFQFVRDSTTTSICVIWKWSFSIKIFLLYKHRKCCVAFHVQHWHSEMRVEVKLILNYEVNWTWCTSTLELFICFSIHF